MSTKFFLREKWKFLFEPTEDYNLGDSLSERSENCSEEVEGEASSICDFGAGVCAIKHSFTLVEG